MIKRLAACLLLALTLVVVKPAYASEPEEFEEFEAATVDEQERVRLSVVPPYEEDDVVEFKTTLAHVNSNKCKFTWQYKKPDEKLIDGFRLYVENYGPDAGEIMAENTYAIDKALRQTSCAVAKISETGAYDLWLTAYKGKVESDPSNLLELTVESDIVIFRPKRFRLIIRR